jgi:hypothetical protein
MALHPYNRETWREKTRIEVQEGEMTETKKKTPWFLWPFVALWRLLGFILELTGRILGVVIGLVLVIVGIVATLTVVGAVVGVPLIVLGLMLMVRGIF